MKSTKKEPKNQKPADESKLVEQIAQFKDMLQRLQAEFENYKKRASKEQEQQTQKERHSILVSLLPLVDGFELALQNTDDPEAFKKGIELLYVQLHTLLEQQGVRKIEALGKPLDPFKHEVVMKEKGKEDNIVVEELQCGYQLGDAVIRHSKVKVSVTEDEKND